MGRIVALAAALSMSVPLSVLAQASQPSGLAQLSAICGTESRPGWREIFAYDGIKWKKYRAVSDIPETQDGSAQFAQVWAGPMGMTLVTINTNLQNNFRQTSYCFNRSGWLIALTHELQTAEGRGLVLLQRYDVSGHALSSSMRFSATVSASEPGNSNKQADKQAKALNPTVYSRFEDLPFANLYRPLTESERY